MSPSSVPKVMLIEDDPQFVYLIQRYARSSGCQVIHVDPVSQTVPLAQEELPDLILLDISLSGADGWQVLHALKADPISRKVPVYVCSASETTIHECEEQADGCLLKPVMYEDFLAALAKVKSSLPEDSV